MTTKAEVSIGDDFSQVTVATGGRIEWTVSEGVTAWLEDTMGVSRYVGAELGIRYLNNEHGDSLYHQVEIDKRDVANWGKIARLVTGETVRLKNIEFSL